MYVGVYVCRLDLDRTGLESSTTVLRLYLVVSFDWTSEPKSSTVLPNHFLTNDT